MRPLDAVRAAVAALDAAGRALEAGDRIKFCDHGEAERVPKRFDVRSDDGFYRQAYDPIVALKGDDGDG